MSAIAGIGDENVLVRDPDDWRKWFCTDETVKIIAKEPHKLGWLIGFEDLVPLHSEWIRYVWDSNEHRALQAYRGSYKSSSIIVTGAIRRMLFRPNDRILLVRKTFKASSEVTKAVSQAMQLQQIQELFKYVHGKYPAPVIDRDGALKYSFKSTITPEGNMTASGIYNIKTGSHFEKILCDDIMTLEDRISKAIRLRTIEMIREIAANIIDPGNGVGWIGTPWHREDGWRVINSFCPIARYPVSQYPLHSEEEIERKRKTTTPYLFAANYELELGKDESLLFYEPLWPRKWDYSIRGAVAQLDTAFDGDHYCALTIAAPTRKEGDNQFYQGSGRTYPGNVEDWEAEIERLCNRYKVKYIWVENNADKGACAKRLSKRGLTVKSYGEGMNKHVKIGTYLYPVWNYIEWDEETDEEYMSQVTEYKEGVQPDDAPDSAASLFKQEFSDNSVVLDDDALRFFHGGK